MISLTDRQEPERYESFECLVVVLIVVFNGRTPEFGSACTDIDRAIATEIKSVDVGGRSRLPVGEPSPVGVPVVQEGLVAGLYLGDERRLRCSRVLNGAKLEGYVRCC